MIVGGLEVVREPEACRVVVVVTPIFTGFAALSEAVLAAVLPEDRDVVLDLRWIEMLHSPTLAGLASLHLALRDRGANLTITGLNALNRSLILRSRLDTLLTLADPRPNPTNGP